jgi:hypothetical protein
MLACYTDWTAPVANSKQGERSQTTATTNERLGFIHQWTFTQPRPQRNERGRASNWRSSEESNLLLDTNVVQHCLLDVRKALRECRTILALHVSQRKRLA